MTHAIIGGRSFSHIYLGHFKRYKAKIVHGYVVLREERDGEARKLLSLIRFGATPAIIIRKIDITRFLRFIKRPVVKG